MDNFATVYWIRTPEMSDIEVEGYVGVSKNLRHREACHLYSCKNREPNYHEGMIVAMNGGNYVIEEVFWGERGDCLKLEHKLRPNYNIGWNRKCGGENLPFEVDTVIYSAYRRLRHISKKNGCVIKPLWETTQGYLDFKTFYVQGINNGEYEMVLPKQGIVDETTVKFLTREELTRLSKQTINFFNDGVLYSQAELAELLGIDKPNTLTTQIKRNWSYGKIFMKAWNNEKARLNT